MENLEVYNRFRTPPKEALKPITAGRLKGKSDINPMWRIKALTEQFGMCGIGWYYNVVNKWTEQSGDEIAAFVDIELFVVVNGKESKPIHGTGGSMLRVREKNGMYTDDEAYKKATTDAISVACKQLGFAADVYWDKDSTKYDRREEEPGNKQAEQANRTVDADPDLIPHGEGMTEKRLARIKSEMDRTGITELTLLTMFRVQALKDLSESQYIAMINKFRQTPDKTA